MSHLEHGSTRFSGLRRDELRNPKTKTKTVLFAANKTREILEKFFFGGNQPQSRLAQDYAGISRGAMLPLQYVPGKLPDSSPRSSKVTNFHALT
jgi:hypothetical protein